MNATVVSKKAPKLVPELVLIDASISTNVRVAILDKRGELCDLFFQTEEGASSHLHSICVGVVTSVEPSLEAAFVDIGEYGGKKNGFLSYKNIHRDYLKVPVGALQDFGQVAKQNKDEEDEYDTDKDIENDGDFRIHDKYKINETVSKGQTMLVQIYKDGRGSKGPSLTTHISITNRYCILSPNAQNRIGISSRIEDQSERKRLLEIAKKFPRGDGMRIIIRTAADGVSEEDIKADYDHLLNLWTGIKKRALQAKGAELVYSDSGLGKIVRDRYASTIKKVIVDENAHEEVKQVFASTLPKERVDIVKYDSKVPMFQKYSVEEKIYGLLQGRVPLVSGGSLVIAQTEALVSIDVNSGRGKLGRDVEEMALQTNLEAAEMIARQLRLRELGGLVVIDFIDMELEEHRRQVEIAMRDYLAEDRARVQLGRISGLGLMQLSRQRTKPSLSEMVTIPCQTCCGVGRVLSGEFVSNSIIGAISSVISNVARSSRDQKLLIVKCGPVVAQYIHNNPVKQTIESIGKQFGVEVEMQSDATIPSDGFVIEQKVTKNNQTIRRILVEHRGSVSGEKCGYYCSSSVGFLSHLMQKIKNYCRFR